MDRAYIREQHLVERYLQGKLAGDELTAFELYMLDHPEIVDDVECEKGMQEALRNANDDIFFHETAAAPVNGRATFWLSRRYAAAAAVLLASTLSLSGYLYQQVGELRAANAELRNPSPISGEVWLEPVRGEREWVIESPGDAALVVRVDVSATPSDAYTVELRGGGTDVSWTRSEIKPDDEQSIRLMLSHLPPGEYRLSISDDGGSDPVTPVAEYRFLLRQPEE